MKLPGGAVALAVDELDTLLPENVNESDAALARRDLERAAGRGFAYCRAVFLADGSYDGLWERAHPTNGSLDWGRGQHVTERNFFRDGKLVRDPEWKAPPPEKAWEHAGLRCEVRMTNLGHRCGYAAVPEAHPWHKLEYNECPDKCGESWCSHRPESRIEVHGGLTYSGGDGAWWFGFDCAHLGDAPSPEAVERQRKCYGMALCDRDGHYWTLEEVARETERMAEQLAAVAEGSVDHG